MEVKRGSTVLFLIFVIKQVTARHAGHISDLLEHLHLSSNRDPLIVVLNTKAQPQDVEDSADIYITADDGISEDTNVYEDVKEEAKYLLYNYLLRTGDPQNTEEVIEDGKKTALREALRARCQARVECEEKCEKKEKKKKNNYCPVNCKAVFDKLNLCEPPKESKKCKKEDACGKRGRTMPPKWF